MEFHDTETNLRNQGFDLQRRSGGFHVLELWVCLALSDISRTVGMMWKGYRLFIYDHRRRKEMLLAAELEKYGPANRGKWRCRNVTEFGQRYR